MKNSCLPAVNVLIAKLTNPEKLEVMSTLSRQMEGYLQTLKIPVVKEKPKTEQELMVEKIKRFLAGDIEKTCVRQVWVEAMGGTLDNLDWKNLATITSILESLVGWDSSGDAEDFEYYGRQAPWKNKNYKQIDPDQF